MNIFQTIEERFLNIKIAYKFLILLLVFSVGLTVIGVAFQSALTMAEKTQKNVAQESIISKSLAHIQFEILTAMFYENNFRQFNQPIKRESFKKSLQEARNELESLTLLFKKDADTQLIIRLRSVLDRYEIFFARQVQSSIESDNTEVNAIMDQLKLELFNLLTLKTNYDSDVKIQFEQTYSNIKITFWVTMGIVFFMLISILWWTVILAMVRPISELQSVINSIAAGNLGARVNAINNDEVGHLANSFDSLFDERVTSLAKTEYDHQRLNASIVVLLRAVSDLSQKDLTIKVPVAEDMTGAVSDSINLLSQEMGRTLKGVADISERVNITSEEVKQQAADVMIYANNQRQEIEATLSELNTVVKMMIKIAKFSQITNKESEKTMLSTESAVGAVSETVVSINGIRDIVRETEKRIKRLGERSQEITVVVNIINTIAERTHVLSLNAGMQAAAAGDAGKGFMVVANEVQRLAESSHEATEKIATLVKNIQVDTSDTMKTMNSVITQVVDCIRQAEDAGERMKESRATTESLVSAVKKISVATVAQLDIGESLKEHAETIQLSTIKANEQLQQQSKLSDDLVQNAQELIVKVNVFKLPE
ncbi:MAG: methyl-accepting chemotaxis protein [Methylococcales bacterium]|nr:methyl-accepting chemotaxis protein [Methylococcales bacterium]